MTIRKITEENHDAFRALRLEALRDAPTAFGSDYEREAAFSVEKFNRGLSPDSEFREAFILGAWSDSNDLVGMAGFHVPNRLKTRHKAWIWGMYVKPHQRSQGIGESLLRAIFESAKGIDGLEYVHLTVIAANDAAHRLYRRLGFNEYGREPSAIKVDGVDYDEIFMAIKTADLS